MKRLVLILVAILSIGFAVSASEQGQKPQPKMWKEIQEYKLKFLAQEIELKEDQKAEFVDTYNAMSQQKFKNFDEMSSLEKKLNDNSTDAQYKEVSDKIAELKMKDAQLEKVYDEKFSKFLTQKQIYKMKAAEEKFRQKMREMHHKNKSKKTAKSKKK